MKRKIFNKIVGGILTFVMTVGCFATSELQSVVPDFSQTANAATVADTYFAKVLGYETNMSCEKFRKNVKYYAEALLGYKYGLDGKYPITNNTLDCISYVQAVYRFALGWNTGTANSSTARTSWKYTNVGTAGLYKPYDTSCEYFKSYIDQLGVSSDTMNLYENGKWKSQSEINKLLVNYEYGDFIFFYKSGSSKPVHVGIYGGLDENNDHIVYDCSSDTGKAVKRTLENKISKKTALTKIEVYKMVYGSAYVSLTLDKNLTNNGAMTGAKFELYSDPSCKTKIGTLTEGSTKGVYDNLVMTTMYDDKPGNHYMRLDNTSGDHTNFVRTFYVKETTAPSGWIGHGTTWNFLASQRAAALTATKIVRIEVTKNVKTGTLTYSTYEGNTSTKLYDTQTLANYDYTKDRVKIANNSDGDYTNMINLSIKKLNRNNYSNWKYTVFRVVYDANADGEHNTGDGVVCFFAYDFDAGIWQTYTSWENLIAGNSTGVQTYPIVAGKNYIIDEFYALDTDSAGNVYNVGIDINGSYGDSWKAKNFGTGTSVYKSLQKLHSEVTYATTHYRWTGKILESTDFGKYAEQNAANTLTSVRLRIDKNQTNDQALKGAVFTVYADSSCKTVIGTLTEGSTYGIYDKLTITNSNYGYTGTLNLDWNGKTGSKTVYIKETTAPTQYATSSSTWANLTSTQRAAILAEQSVYKVDIAMSGTSGSGTLTVKTYKRSSLIYTSSVKNYNPKTSTPGTIANTADGDFVNGVNFSLKSKSTTDTNYSDTVKRTVFQLVHDADKSGGWTSGTDTVIAYFAWSTEDNKFMPYASLDDIKNGKAMDFTSFLIAAGQQYYVTEWIPMANISGQYVEVSPADTSWVKQSVGTYWTNALSELSSSNSFYKDVKWQNKQYMKVMTIGSVGTINQYFDFSLVNNPAGVSLTLDKNNAKDEAMSGATFTVYADSSCKTVVGTLTEGSTKGIYDKLTVTNGSYKVNDSQNTLSLTRQSNTKYTATYYFKETSGATSVYTNGAWVTLSENFTDTNLYKIDFVLDGGGNNKGTLTSAKYMSTDGGKTWSKIAGTTNKAYEVTTKIPVVNTTKGDFSDAPVLTIAKKTTTDAEINEVIFYVFKGSTAEDISAENLVAIRYHNGSSWVWQTKDGTSASTNLTMAYGSYVIAEAMPSGQHNESGWTETNTSALILAGASLVNAAKLEIDNSYLSCWTVADLSYKTAFDKTVGETVYNERTTTGLKVHKEVTDETDTVEGIKFELRDAAGETVYATGETNSDGNVIWEMTDEFKSEYDVTGTIMLSFNCEDTEAFAEAVKAGKFKFRLIEYVPDTTYSSDFKVGYEYKIPTGSTTITYENNERDSYENEWTQIDNYFVTTIDLADEDSSNLFASVVTLKNDREEISLKVVKEAEDGIVSGITFKIYGSSDKSEWTLIDTSKTNNKGQITISGLPYAYYKVEEVVEDYYALSWETDDVSVPYEVSGNAIVLDMTDGNVKDGGTVTVTAYNKIDATIRVDKQDKWTGEVVTTKAESDRNAVFALYKAISSDDTELTVGEDGTIENELVATIEDEDGDGIVRFEGIETGTYLVVETVAPEGYYLDTTPVVVTVDKAAEIEAKKADSPFAQPLRIYKKDALTGDILVGASFKIYSDNDGDGTFSDGDTVAKTKNNKQVAISQKEDADGIACYETTYNLPVGKYVVVETQAPARYFFVGEDGKKIDNPTVYAFEVVEPSDFDGTQTEGEYKVAYVETDVANTTGSVVIYKIDDNGDFVTGCEFEIATDKDFDEVLGVLTEDVENGIYYYNELDYGTYYVRETKSGSGHETDGNVYKATISDEQIQYVIDNAKVYGVEGKFVNINPLQETYFLATDVDNYEDGKDYWSRMLPYDTEVAVSDYIKYVGLHEGETYTVKGSIVLKSTGAVLGNYTTEVEFTPESENGTLEVDFGTINTTLIPDGDSIVATAKIYRDGRLVGSHTDLNDYYETLTPVTLHTTATDNYTKTHTFYIDDVVTVNDVVEYTHVKYGEEYVTTGVLHNQDTGEAIVDDEGNEITNTVSFVAGEQDGDKVYEDEQGFKWVDGKVTVTFEFPVKLLVNEEEWYDSAVAFEDLFHKRDKELLKIAVHHSITDDDQTVNPGNPSLETSFIDAKTEDHISSYGDKVDLTDYISYKNLIPGREYTIISELRDKETGYLLLDSDGNKMHKETTFVPEKTEGTTSVTFTVDVEDFAGKSIVAYESLYLGDLFVGDHTDIEDAEQTINVPFIETQFADVITDERIATYGEEVGLVDYVYYENLIVGKTYTVTGTVMVKSTGEPLTQNGETVTNTVTFKAEQSDGVIEVPFTIDTTAIAGEDIVAFETLKNDKDIELWVHADLTDLNQTIPLPKVGTKFLDCDTETHTAAFGFDVDLIDYVSYENLEMNRIYVVEGVLVDRATRQPLTREDGSQITGSVRFVPDEPSGTVEVVFSDVDTSELGGTVMVAFEELYIVLNEETDENGEIISTELYKVSEHKDLDDSDQTVYVPTAKTYAETSDGQKTVDLGSVINIVDTVCYTGLTPGEKYRTEASLYLSDGTVLTDIYSVEFTPDSVDGFVSVTIPFDTSVLESGDVIVVFENVYHVSTETLVACHNDLTDEDQSITVTSLLATGFLTPLYSTVGSVLVGIVALCGICFLFRRKKQED